MNVNNFNNFYVQFKGLNCKPNLYHHLKKDLCSGTELLHISNIVNDEQRTVGCLPKEWMENIEPDKIGEKTKQVHNALADFSKVVYSCETNEQKEKIDEILEVFRYRYFMEGHTEEETRKATKRVEDLITQKSREVVHASMKKIEAAMGSILDLDCEISYVDAGSSGTVFKVTAGDKSCALKVFKPRTSNLHLLSRHGEKSEIAGAIFLNKNVKPSQCAKFYLGRFSSNKQNDGYMLTGYVEKLEDRDFNRRGVWDCSEKCSISKYSINDVNSDNVIDGKLIDFGGVIQRFQNEEQRTIAKKLYPLVQKNDIEGIDALRREYANSADFLTVLRRIL